MLPILLSLIISNSEYNVIEDLDLSIDMVTVKREQLDKANTNLSRQQKVLDTLVGLGYPVHAQREINE